MTLDVYRGRKTTMQQQQHLKQMPHFTSIVGWGKLFCRHFPDWDFLEQKDSYLYLFIIMYPG